jgi:predicted nucleic acid-binding protein
VRQEGETVEITFGLLREAGAAAHLTTDAQLAALAIESQGEVHSNDVDFGRFSQLRWVNPLAGGSLQHLGEVCGRNGND